MRLIYYSYILKSAPLEPVYFNYLTPGRLFMNKDMGATPLLSPLLERWATIREVMKVMKIILAGLAIPIGNSNEYKNKKTKHSHSIVDSSSFSQISFVCAVRFRTNEVANSISTKSSINHKKLN